MAYSEAAKTALLGIAPAEIRMFEAVSQEIAVSMARSIRHQTGADYAVAVTGNTGPPGETGNGLVHIAVYGPEGVAHRRCMFGDVDRVEGRALTAHAALSLLRGQMFRKHEGSDEELM